MGTSGGRKSKCKKWARPNSFNATILIWQPRKRRDSIKDPEIDIDLGEENEHLLDFSKLNTLMNNADLVVKKTDIFIKELEKYSPAIYSIVNKFVNWFRINKE